MSKPKLPLDYLVIEGNIGAGKTTLTRMLGERYGARVLFERFGDNPFLPLFYADKERYALLVELFFMAERHSAMTPLLTQPTLFGEPLLSDYLFIKTWLFARKTLRAHELDLFRKLFEQLNAQVPIPQRLVYLHRPIPVLLKQIANRGRDYERQIAPEYLAGIEQTYWEYLRSEHRFPILFVDCGEANFEHDHRVFDQITEALEGPVEDGLTMFTLALER